jgi:hypothetical protein
LKVVISESCLHALSLTRHSPASVLVQRRLLTVKVGTRLVPAGQNFAASQDRLRGPFGFSFFIRIKQACEAFSTGASPLGFGSVMLDDGPCRGFLAEPAGIGDAPDITHLGGWRD